MSAQSYRLTRIGLLVTGDGEAEYLPQFFRALTAHQTESGSFSQIQFDVIARVKQLSNRQSTKKHKPLKAGLATLEEEIGLHARSYLDAHRQVEAFVLLIDDLEYDRISTAHEILTRYQQCFTLIPAADRWRTAVFFLVMMLEAYFMADHQATNEALKITLDQFEGDVETIRHPKNELSEVLRQVHGIQRKYREIDDGRLIVQQFDLQRVLNDPETCTALRSLVAWCWHAARRPLSTKFQLLDGKRDARTESQVELLQNNLPSTSS